MNEKSIKFLNIIEPVIILIIFFLIPLISLFMTKTKVLAFDNIYFYIQYFITFIIKFFIMIFIIRLNPNYTFYDFGFRKIKISDLKYIIIIVATILAILSISSYILIKLNIKVNQENLIRADKKFIPLLFILFICVGYIEEIVFRAYSTVFFEKHNINKYIGLIVSTILFTSLHIYQGIAPTIIIFFVAITLYVFYLKIRNLHILAIAHGIFDFIQILILIYSQL